jgi:hypothetical protein
MMPVEITLDDGTTTLQLPPDLQWKDEFTWNAVEQDQEYSLTGNHVVQEGVKQDGRAITLVGGSNASWIDRQTLLDLQLISNVPDQTLTLVLWGTTYTVMFRRPAIEAEEVIRAADPDVTHKYAVTINLMEVNP